MNKDNANQSGSSIKALLYGIAAVVLLLGAAFRVFHLPGAVPLLLIGMVLSTAIFVLESINYFRRTQE